MESYQIKEGFRCNLDGDGRPISYDDLLVNSSVYQIDVYKYVAQLIKASDIRNCLDIGCGCAYKLVKYIYPICKDITGIDREHAIRHCRRNYSLGEWYVDDLENPRFPVERKYELIICVDVIEHLAEPNHILNYIKHHSTAKTSIIISTPERDIVRGVGDFGPPGNPTHVREWNRKEFRSYLESQNFTVDSHFLLKDKKTTIRQVVKMVRSRTFSMPRRSCQVCVCRVGGTALL